MDEDEDKAPNYYTVITEPMDLNTLSLPITNRSITTADGFVNALMKIWDNAQMYNRPVHTIHQDAQSLRATSTKLIKLHFPLITVHKRVITAKFHLSKGLLCGVCNEPLSFEIGYHETCEMRHSSSHPFPLELKCTECHRKLDDLHFPYYHCVSGCTKRTDKRHSIFLCVSCAESKYHTKQLMIGNTRNKYSDSGNIAFRGLFVDLTISDDKLSRRSWSEDSSSAHNRALDTMS